MSAAALPVSQRRLGPVLAAGLVAAEVALAAALGLSVLEPALVFGAIAVGGIVTACVLAPRGTLIVLAALWAPSHLLLTEVPLARVAGIDVNVSRALGVAVVLGLGAFLISDPRPRRAPGALALLGAFLALYAVAAALSASGSDGAIDLLRVASAVVVAFAAFRLIDNTRRLELLARAVTAAGVGIAVVAIAQFFLHSIDAGLAEGVFGSSFYHESETELGDASAVRVVGLVGGTFGTAAVLLAAAAFALLRIGLLGDGESARGPTLALAVISFGIVATLTRATIGALVILLVVWAVQRQYESRTLVSVRVRLLLSAGLAVVVLVPVIGAEAVRARLWDVNPATSGEQFAQGRGGIWADRLEQLQNETPLAIAIGSGAHSSYRPPGKSGITASEELSPHNLLLWLLIETGVVGAALFLLALLGFGRRYWRATQAERYRAAGRIGAVGLAALAAFLVMNALHLSLNSPAHGWYFMLFFGATLGALGPRELE